MAQTHTLGLFVYDSAACDGYNLFGSIRSNTTYLTDMYGHEINSWQATYPPGNSVYLLENGHLLRPSRPDDGGGGLIQEFDWDGALVWEFTYYDATVRQHHDVEPMPNGNVLLLAWEYKTLQQAIAAGRDTSLLADTTLWPEHVVEVEPSGATGGSIVWEWHLWDHLIQDFDPTKGNYGVVADHPELVNINWVLNFNDDWIHANAVDYNAELDQIVISSRTLSEFWVIDHSTTSAEAAAHTGGNSGRGGDLLYRWGNPQVYDAGDEADQKLYLQHDAQWIAPGCPGEGNFLVYNNGGQQRSYSTADEIASPVDGSGQYPQPAPGAPYPPAEASWVYGDDPPGSFFSVNISGAQRLANGNTLICEGDNGHFFEVTPAGEIVWDYFSPATREGPAPQGSFPGDNKVFRCERYPAEYPGLQGRDLTPGPTIETYPVTLSATGYSPSDPWSDVDSVVVTTKVWSDNGVAQVELNFDAGSGYVAAAMHDDGLGHDSSAGDSVFTAVIPPQPDSTVVAFFIAAENGAAQTNTDPPYAPDLAVYRYLDRNFPCGDIDTNGDGPDISDLVYLVDWMFTGGPPPAVMDAADVDNSGGEIDISDLVYLVDYMFTGGPAPVCR